LYDSFPGGLTSVKHSPLSVLTQLAPLIASVSLYSQHERRPAGASSDYSLGFLNALNSTISFNSLSSQLVHHGLITLFGISIYCRRISRSRSLNLYPDENGHPRLTRGLRKAFLLCGTSESSSAGSANASSTSSVTASMPSSSVECEVDSGISKLRGSVVGAYTEFTYAFQDPNRSSPIQWLCGSQTRCSGIQR
jgi:hypothetical protein